MKIHSEQYFGFIIILPYITFNEQLKMFSFVFQIPLNVIMELNEVKNVSQLFAQFMPDEDVYEAQSRVATTGFQSKSNRQIILN